MVLLCLCIKKPLDIVYDESLLDQDMRIYGMMIGKTANSLKESSVALHRSIGSVRDVVNCCQATIRVYICDAGKINGQI